MELRAWQKEAIERWNNNNYRGTFNVTTGAGKTFAAIEIIKQIKGRVLIVVPTAPLLNQWKKELKKYLKEPIGVYYSKKKEVQRILVAVINSVRERTINNCELLILDEVHRYQSPQNSKLLLRNTFPKILGLSATPTAEDPFNNIALRLAPVIFEYGKREAIRDGVLCDYEVINIPVLMNVKELEKHDYLSSVITVSMRKFDYDLKKAMSRIRFNDRDAIDLIKAISKRKDIIYNSFTKVQKAVELIKENPDRKIILFDERITNLELIERLLKNNHTIKPLIYHSKLKLKERREILVKFAQEKVGILLSAKCLDEGLNVPDANMAILLNGSSVKRQYIQRVGRVLRVSDNKLKATIYQIYLANSVDEKWLLKRLS